VDGLGHPGYSSHQKKFLHFEEVGKWYTFQATWRRGSYVVGVTKECFLSNTASNISACLSEQAPHRD